MKNGFVCFPPSEKIICNPQIKSISDIKIGDKVLTHKGQYKQVEKIFKRHYKGDLIKIKTKKFNLDMKTTTNHPIYTAVPEITINNKKHFNCKWKENDDIKLIKNKIYGNKINEGINKSTKSCIQRLNRLKNRYKITYNYNWIPAEKINKNYFLVYPIHKTEKLPENNINSCIFCKSKNLGARGFTSNGRKRIYCKECKKSFLQDYLQNNKLFDYNDKDLCYLLGLFLADGDSNIVGGKVRFSIGQKIVKKTEEKIQKVFGLIPTIYKIGNFYSVQIHSRKLAREFEKLGKGQNKHPPIEILNLNDECSLSFIEGYMDGDGFIRIPKDKKYKIYQFSTISPNNLFIITQLLLKQGIIPSISKYKTKPSLCNGKTIKSSEGYKLTYTEKFNLKGVLNNNNLLLPISEIKKEEYDGLVYNMMVADDNSYTTMISAVHNCMDELWLIADCRTSRSTKNRITANILAKSRHRDLTIAFTAQVISSVDNRIRQIVDFLSYPIMNPDETVVKLLVFRGSKANNGSYMKTLYYKTSLIFQLFDTHEEVQMKEESDTPMLYCFQVDKDSPPLFFNTWEEADKYAENWWTENQKLLKEIF